MNLKSLVGFVCLALGAAAFANDNVKPPELIGQLAAVGGLQIVDITGCGQPPPGGGACPPDRVSVRFIVPYGGTCHSYSATVLPSTNGEGSVLSIYDLEYDRCTRPEQKDYQVELNLKAPPNGPVKLANPLYVIREFAP